jgi:Xaa-Pro dipeptidase
VQTEVRTAGAAAAVAASPESVRHLAGVHFASQVMIRRRLAFVVIPAQGEPALLVQAVLEGTARQRSQIPDVRTYLTGPVDGLARYLTEAGLDRGPLLVEMDFLPAADERRLAAAVPATAILDAGDLFQRARQVRTPSEMAEHRLCAEAAERAIQTAFGSARPGQTTERDVYTRLANSLLALRGGTIPFLTLSSGPDRTRALHADPSDRVIEAGDVLLVDLVGFFGGLYTDIARTVVVGKATSDQAKLYRRVRAVQQAVIADLRPGMTAGHVYDIFTKHADAHGQSFRYRYVGHSTGYEVVEEPVLTAGSDRPILPGMVLSVEVKDTEPGVGAVHLEDMLALTDRGVDVWTTAMAAPDVPEVG